MEPSVLRRSFPSLYRAALSGGRASCRLRRRFSWAWVKLALALGSCSAWIGLWVESHTWHRVAGDEPALAARVAGLLVQATSYRPGTLHLVMMRDRSGRPATLSVGRLTQLGNGGYHHGRGSESSGFALALQPQELIDGDSLVHPYLGLAVPYWFLTAATGLLIPWYAGRLTRPGRGSTEARESGGDREVAAAD